MSFHVRDLLKRARSAPGTVSALDAVMGEDWAIVDAGRARRARDMQMGGLRRSKAGYEAGALLAAHKRDVDRMRPAAGGGGRLPGRNPQAVVKMIRNGGASDLRGMKAQMDYLSREGKEPLERSEAQMGIEIDAEQEAEMAAAWRMPPEGSGRADRTSHFLASFPEGTDAEAAKRAGRAWAEEMFGSGKYGGDSYDYYTAFHTDRAHPHMHVIVYRRGLEEGAWLKVSQQLLQEAADPSTVRDLATFTRIAELVRADCPSRTQAAVRVAAQTLAAQAEVERELQLFPADDPLRIDVTEQLANLTFNRFISATPDPWFNRLPTYVGAVSVRLRGAMKNRSRDDRARSEVEDVEAQYAALCDAQPPGPLRPDVEEVAFLIEELRVSLFAQGVRTAVPISVKRIRQAMAAVV